MAVFFADLVLRGFPASDPDWDRMREGLSWNATMAQVAVLIEREWARAVASDESCLFSHLRIVNALIVECELRNDGPVVTTKVLVKLRVVGETEVERAQERLDGLLGRGRRLHPPLLFDSYNMKITRVASAIEQIAYLKEDY